MTRHPGRFLAICATILWLGAHDALAQRERSSRPERPERAGWPAPQRMNPEERQRLREDVNSARGDYRNERQRSEESGNRLSPEERERLRRDVFDANRDLRRR